MLKMAQTLNSLVDASQALVEHVAWLGDKKDSSCRLKSLDRLAQSFIVLRERWVVQVDREANAMGNVKEELRKEKEDLASQRDALEGEKENVRLSKEKLAAEAMALQEEQATVVRKKDALESRRKRLDSHEAHQLEWNAVLKDQVSDLAEGKLETEKTHKVLERMMIDLNVTSEETRDSLGSRNREDVERELAVAAQTQMQVQEELKVLENTMKDMVPRMELVACEAKMEELETKWAADASEMHQARGESASMRSEIERQQNRGDGYLEDLGRVKEELQGTKATLDKAQTQLDEALGRSTGENSTLLDCRRQPRRTTQGSALVQAPLRTP